jgi:hypothetical protein
MFVDDVVQHFARMQDFARVNIDIGGLATQSALNERLVYVNAGVWK